MPITDVNDLSNANTNQRSQTVTRTGAQLPKDHSDTIRAMTFAQYQDYLRRRDLNNLGGRSIAEINNG